MRDRKSFTIPGEAGTEIQYYINDDPADVRQPKVYPTHIHGCLEIYFLLEGSLEFMADERLYVLNAGDAVFIRPNEVHHCIINTVMPHRHACFWFLSDDEFLFGAFLHRGPDEGSLLSPADPEDRAAALRAVRRLAQIQGQNTFSEYSHIIGLLDLWQSCLKNHSGAPEKSAAGQYPQLLRLILDDISAHLPEIRGLSYLTEKYGMSPAQLRRLFALYLRTTPKSYIENKRLARSCALLRSGAGVNEACAEAGFTNLSNYVNMFHRRFGITPSAYRSGKEQLNLDEYF